MTQALGEPAVGLGGDALGRVRRVAAEAGNCLELLTFNESIQPSG